MATGEGPGWIGHFGRPPVGETDRLHLARIMPRLGSFRLVWGVGVEPFEEPVRGEPLTAAAFALDGLDRLRGWGRLWPPTPMFHLLGLRITQVVNGSAVASMPVTPWLMHPDGVIDVGFAGLSLCGVAADTILKPGYLVTPIQGSYRPLRRVGDDTRSLVARASVVRSSEDWAYVEGAVEDGEGRVVAHVSVHAAIRPANFPVPDQLPEFEPIAAPKHPTPDAFRRPLPPEKYEVIDRFRRDGCVSTFKAIASGDAPLPPLYALLGIRPVEARAGTVTTELATSGWLLSVHPTEVTSTYLEVQAVSTGVAAIWSIAPDGTWPAVLDVHSQYDALPAADGRRITARATAERLGDELVHARVDTMDGDRVVGVTHVSGQFRMERGPDRSHRARFLATVLFTDVVRSTETAGRLGDQAWADVLERHERLTRKRIQEHGGREIKSTGDGFLAIFDSPSEATACAVALVEDVRKLGLVLRAGLHTGEVELAGGDVAGLTVHVAARVEGAAAPGEVWASETVKTLSMGSSIRFEDRGLHDLKGVEEPLRLYAVV